MASLDGYIVLSETSSFYWHKLKRQMVWWIINVQSLDNCLFFYDKIISYTSACSVDLLCLDFTGSGQAKTSLRGICWGSCFYKGCLSAPPYSHLPSAGIDCCSLKTSLRQVLYCHWDTPNSLQETYLAPKFKEIVQYCRSSRASRDGLLDLLEEEAGELGCDAGSFISVQCSSKKE